MKRTITTIIIITLIVVATVVTRSIILGGAKVVTMPNDQIAWLTATSLDQVAGKSYTPILGKDYTTKTTYFDSKQWAVTSVSPVNGSSDPSTIIFKQTNGSYAVALGPSNVLHQAGMAGFPTDVTTYVTSLGVVSGVRP